MAGGSANNAYHSTLSANTAETVTLTTTAGSLTILNKSTAFDIFVSINQGDPTQTPPVPTVGGSGFYCVSQNGPRQLNVPIPGGMKSGARAVQVSLISAGTNTYTVQDGYVG